MKQKLTLLIAAASLALPLSASTTDSLRTANIDEVLVYGTRSILPLKKVPSKIEVISAETIQRSGFTSLPDLLKNYSSVDIIQYPGFNATVGIRGFKPGKAYTTVLINGIPTASENISTIALSDIAQVEILKGPFSSVYGTNAMGGVINIVTVQHKEQLTGRVSATAGSYDNYAGTLALGGRRIIKKKAGAAISDLTNDEIVRTDMKEFSEAGQTISIGQISVMDTTDVLAKQAELVAALEALRTANGYAASYIMVTNILDESTTLIYSGDVESVVVNAFGKDVKDNAVFLPNTMSRKKQIVPPILGAMK